MNTEHPHNRGDSPAEQLGESVLSSDNAGTPDSGRGRKRAPQYVDGPALHHALWRRNRGRLLWVSVTLGIVAVSILASGLIGVPHVILVFLSIPLLAMALVGLPHLLRDPLVRTIVVRAAARRLDRAAGSTSPPSISSDEFKTTFALVVGVRLTAGNQVDVLTNGTGTFERLWSDLRAAQHSITVQVYYAGPGIVADMTIGILATRARAGVDVFFLYDAFGTEDLPQRYIETLRAAGVRTAAYRPVRWYALNTAAHRLHVRGVVVDGRVGYTGGFGIDDKWLGNGRAPGEWRETNVRFVGPAVAELQAGFVAGWCTATGEVLIGDSLMGMAETSASATQGGFTSGAGSAEAVLSAVVRSPPLMGSTAAERLLALAIASAARTLYISNAYFVPTLNFTKLLIEAARHGVDVRVLTNGRRSDVRTTWLAGRRSYEPLLREGIRIFEYRATIHAKTFVVDGHLCAVGTMNFDNRSLAYNNEVALVTLDAMIGKYMDSLFFDDARYSDEIVLAHFQTRAWSSRVLERVASFGSRLL